MAQTRRKIIKFRDLSAYIPASLITPRKLDELIDTIESKITEKNWAQYGSCLEKNSDIFSTESLFSEQTPQLKAQQICGTCPVKQYCAKQALDNPENHAYTVMGGVSLPYNPHKSGRAMRQLEQQAQPDGDVKKKIRWHVTFTIQVLRAREFDTVSAWTMVSNNINWAVFKHTCLALGLKPPASPRNTASVECEPRKKCHQVEGA